MYDKIEYMTNPSNLYAEKIFSEHPISLWALDDRVDFVSLLDNNDKAMSGWTITNGTFLSSANVSPQVAESPTIGLETDGTDLVTIVSPVIINSSDLDPDKNTINIATHFKTSAEVTVKLGYKIGSETPVTETFNYVPGNQEEWAFLSKSFSVPASDSDISLYVSLQQEIEISSEFYFNNLSFGQWSEAFHAVSSGVIPQLLSSYDDVALPSGTMAVPAQSYGLANSDGYYLSSANRLFATNEGFPIVYGASNLTKLFTAVSNQPSLIVPGSGFLNDSGKYVDMTAEMWLRVTPKSRESRRIFGPIASSDGIYVQGEFLVIKIGKHTGSYFVGEWGRPMLIHLRVSVNTASLLIDGEQVISIATDTEALDLPKPFLNSKSQDWLGFYSYTDIDSLELDCVAVYPYQIPEIVAKRRFVYGQGVEFPELSSSSLIGASTFIDYRVANYANNYLYPDMGRWSQGILDNMAVQNNVLTPPKYDLPSVVFNNKSISAEQWLELSEAAGSVPRPSVDLSLANSPSRSGGHLFFPKLNLLSGEVRGFYGVFKTSSASKQVLFRVENSVDNTSFVISAEGNKISYVLNNGPGDTITKYSALSLELGEVFAAGVDIAKLSTSFGGAISKFFGSAGRLSLYVGGQSTFEETLNGKIYSVGISTQRNINKLSTLSDQDGMIAVFDEEDVLELADHTASYTVRPRSYLGSYMLDVSSDSYWQDYVPLTYLAKAVPDADGNQVQTLDFIQLNIDNPVIPKFSGQDYDLSGSEVRSYITFQYMATSPNADHENFIYTQPLPKSGIVDPGENWLLTRYEVVDGTVIYLPRDTSFNKLAIVLHVDISSKSVINSPVKIRTIQLASQALSSIGPTEIATRFGDTLAAYTMRGIYPDYKSRNPVSIYKSSTPYLYLTNTSGIQMKGILESTKRRGIRSKINSQRSNLYRVGAIQILSRYPEEVFPATPQKLITISAKNKTLSLYVVASNQARTRGSVYVLNDKTSLPDPTVFFYLNGNIVKDLYLTPNSWSMLGIQFQESLDFNSIEGYLDITGPLLVHGMSNYRLTSSQDSLTSILRTWSQVRTMVDKGGSEVTYWGDFTGYYDEPTVSWENILYIPTLKTYLFDPRVVYRLYTGTNKVIVGDDNKLRFNSYSYKVYNDISWKASILTAV
jgi:hypothetical protein